MTSPAPVSSVTWCSTEEFLFVVCEEIVFVQDAGLEISRAKGRKRRCG